MKMVLVLLGCLLLGSCTVNEQPIYAIGMRQSRLLNQQLINSIVKVELCQYHDEEKDQKACLKGLLK